MSLFGLRLIPPRPQPLEPTPSSEEPSSARALSSSLSDASEAERVPKRLRLAPAPGEEKDEERPKKRFKSHVQGSTEASAVPNETSSTGASGSSRRRGDCFVVGGLWPLWPLGLSSSPPLLLTPSPRPQPRARLKASSSNLSLPLRLLLLHPMRVINALPSSPTACAKPSR